MKGRCNAATVLALMLAICGSTAGAQEMLAPASWLAGCWEQSTSGRITHEQWMAPRGALMMGMSRTVVRDTAREYEQLRIEANGGQVRYIAHPSGQAEAAFPATVFTDSLLVFRNPTHDFPQQISYRRLSRDSLVARIEGMQGGQARRINFPMRRVGCGA